MGRNANGFTLLELLVVIAISSTILGLSTVSFNSYNRRERLQQAALVFKSALRFAQTRAISADKPASGCTTFVGMHIAFTLNSYTIQHECTEGIVDSGETTQLPSGVTFFVQPTDFTFMVLSRRADLVSDQTIVLTNATQSYAIEVSVEGEINTLGFQ